MAYSTIVFWLLINHLPTKRLSRFGLWLGFGLSLIVLLFSASKGALISLFAASLIYAFIYYQLWDWHFTDDRSRSLVPLLWILGLLLMIWIMVAHPPGRLIIEGLNKSSPSEQTASLATLTGRIPLWLALFFDSISVRPMLGYGYNSFWGQPPSQGIGQQFRWAGTAHNGYVEVLLDCGLIGLLALFALLGSYISNAWRTHLSNLSLATLWPLLFLVTFMGINIVESSFMENHLSWIIFTATSVLLHDRVSRQLPSVGAM